METMKMRFIICRAVYTHMNNWPNDIKIFHKIMYLIIYLIIFPIMSHIRKSVKYNINF